MMAAFLICIGGAAGMGIAFGIYWALEYRTIRKLRKNAKYTEYP